MDSAKPFVDLHVHTWYSDSTLSPAMAVQAASQNGVGLLAIADHEGFQGSFEAKPLCEKAGIRFIPACETQCMSESHVLYHILCYAMDLTKGPLASMVSQNRRILDDMSVWLVEKMAKDYPQLSREEYELYSYDRSRGGWKGLGYLMEKGITASLREGFPLYEKYGIRYDTAGFPALERTIEAIHLSGGRAVVAHSGHTLRKLESDDFKREIYSLVECGLDGIECYYPLHSGEVTELLLNICRSRELMITAGSDCHGDFGRTRVGQMDIDASKIDLRGI
ncbi:MAG: PHP domain-containing protein [Clostridia bacterium]|nr:PHP domain-containing protein [Clostridia bacterium]